MTKNEYMDYHDTVVKIFEYLGWEYIDDSFDALNKLLGWRRPNRKQSHFIIYWEHPDKQALLRQLAGPHGKTLLKVIELRKQANG